MNRNSKPPKIAEWLLEIFLPVDDLYSSSGDFEEYFSRLVTEQGRLTALLWYWRNILYLFPRKIYHSSWWSALMFRNYMKIALRNIKKHKGYSFINIAGLAVGITCFIFIMMYVKYELSYDTFHDKSNRIFRVGMYWDAWSFRGSSYFASTNGAMASVLPEIFPEIEYAVRLKTVSSSLKYEQTSMVEQGIYADKDFLKVFSFPLIAGNPNTALQDPFTIVLTEELSYKLFGTEDPIGKSLLGFNGFTFTVTGVCKKIPENSHIKFDYIISFLTMYAERDDIDRSWGILNYSNYVQLKKNVPYKEFEKRLEYLVDNYHDPEDHERRYFLQPIESIHLNPNIKGGISQNGDIKYIYLFSAVALLILLIASVNYINLATSRAAVRSKEVGIRKTVGAHRSGLIKQFLGESIILTIFAFMVSLVIVYFAHPFFEAFIDQNISLSIIFNPVSIASLLSIMIFVGFLSGCYPSFLLSSFRPIDVLKAGIKSNSSKNRFKLRNILVVFQFFISIILIIATVVIYKQLSFIKNKDIGYNRENIITISLWNSENVDKFETIKEELVRNSNIISAAISDRAPLYASENNTIRVENETDGEMVSLKQVSHFYIDNDYIDLYNIKIKEGRNFSPDFSTDQEQAVIVNEKLVNMLGLENPIGKRISVNNARDAKIIGVAKDFHYASFTYKIRAIVFVYRPQWTVNILSVKITNSDIKGTLNYIESTFHRHIDDFVFDYSFLDDRYNNLYKSEDRMATLFTGFSIIAIMIASFGLFGLISFIAAQKTKEIGIRKVLGASVGKIIGLVVKEFVVLVIFSSLIALPASYYLMDKWLKDFAYKTSITVWTLLMPVLIVFLVAMLSVIFQVIKAARANPVNSLKYE